MILMTEVAAARIWDGDKFMICQRPAHKARGLLWEFVGGKVEPGETCEQALIRECREELAVTVSVGEVRSTFVIDENGIIEKVMPKVKPDTNAAEILAYLREKGCG